MDINIDYSCNINVNKFLVYQILIWHQDRNEVYQSMSHMSYKIGKQT